GITTSFYGHFVAGQIYNSLIEYHWKTLEPIPELAESWEISEDGLEYTFHLVEDAKWHDGVPFTSADVKYTFEEILLPYHPRGNRTFGFIDFETPDEHTIVFRLDHPYAPLINFLTLWYAPILPKHIRVAGIRSRIKPSTGGPFIEYPRSPLRTFEI
ncbi:Dipeptide transport protein, partial [Thaumarchaeota archaeon SCGC AB-539-E09]